MESDILCYNGTTEICFNYAKSTAYVSVSSISIAINIFNLLVLNTIERSKRTPYFWIIVNIGISDIATTAAHTIIISCELNQRVTKLSF